MEILKAQLYVLRCIAMYRPHAHLAFLFHAPYRAMYDNEGQNTELCESYGQWIYIPKLKFSGHFEKVFHIMRHNKCIYHPKYTFIVIDGQHFLKQIIFTTKGLCSHGYIHLSLGPRIAMEAVHKINKKEVYRSEKQLEEYSHLYERLLYYKKNALHQ